MYMTHFGPGESEADLERERRKRFLKQRIFRADLDEQVQVNQAHPKNFRWKDITAWKGAI